MKKIYTRVSALILAVCCMVTMTAMASSTTSGLEIQPRYIGIDSISPSLVINSTGRADCTAEVKPQKGYSVDFTVELQRDGRGIKSWSGSVSYPDTSEAGGYYYVTKGHEYQAVITAVVKNSSGTTVSSPTVYSSTVSY